MANTALKLEEVKEQFEHWRKTKATKRSRIPDHLWQLAVSLTKDHPVSQVITALRLNFGDLKKRIKTDKKSLAGTEQIKFVQVQPLSNHCDTTNNTLIPVEFKRSDGLTMSLKTTSANFQTIFEAFLQAPLCYK